MAEESGEARKAGSSGDRPQDAEASNYEIRHWRLIRPTGRTGGGVLTTTAKDGNEFAARLDPRIARVLTILLEARQADSDFPLAARGWRSKQDLSELIGKETNYPVDEHSVTAYLTSLVSQVNEAARRAGFSEPPHLIERRRGLGARLHGAAELELFIGSNRSGAAPDPQDAAGSESNGDDQAGAEPAEGSPSGGP